MRMGFCVRLYFDQGEALRRDVEILICMNSITENAKNQTAHGLVELISTKFRYLFSLGYFKKPVSLLIAAE